MHPELRLVLILHEGTIFVFEYRYSFFSTTGAVEVGLQILLINGWKGIYREI